MSHTNRNLAEHLIPVGLDRIFAASQPVPLGEWVPLDFHQHDLAEDQIDMNVDGSVTPIDFEIHVPEGLLFIMAQLVWTARGDKIRLDKFFGIPALTNGVQVHLTDLQTGEEFFGTKFFRRTFDFGRFAPNDLTIWPKALSDDGLDSMIVPWDVGLGGYSPALFAKDLFQVRISDDLTALPEFRLSTWGRLVPEG